MCAPALLSAWNLSRGGNGRRGWGVTDNHRSVRDAAIRTAATRVPLRCLGRGGVGALSVPGNAQKEKKTNMSSDNTAEVKPFCLCIWRCNIQAVTVQATRRGGGVGVCVCVRGGGVREEEIKERRAFSRETDVCFFFFFFLNICNLAD